MLTAVSQDQTIGENRSPLLCSLVHERDPCEPLVILRDVCEQDYNEPQVVLSLPMQLFTQISVLVSCSHSHYSLFLQLLVLSHVISSLINALYTVLL